MWRKPFHRHRTAPIRGIPQALTTQGANGSIVPAMPRLPDMLATMGSSFFRTPKGLDHGWIFSHSLLKFESPAEASPAAAGDQQRVLIRSSIRSGTPQRFDPGSAHRSDCLSKACAGQPVRLNRQAGPPTNAFLSPRQIIPGVNLYARNP